MNQSEVTIYGPIWLLSSLSEKEQLALARGEVIMRGSLAFGLCGECRKVIRVNRPFFGGMHLCASPYRPLSEE